MTIISIRISLGYPKGIKPEKSKDNDFFAGNN